MNRRAFLTGAATVAGASWLPRATGAAGGKTRLILLGTGGGPRPRKASPASAQVIVANGTPYVIDCGDGVARQLVFAGIPLDSLRHVFITHHHSDHNADYGNLIWLAWAAGLRTPVDAWGPPPLERMTRLFFEMNAYDIETRIANEGRVALAPLVHVHERTEGGLVMKDENVTVTAALVDHPPVVPAFGYRVDAADRSIVISATRAPTAVELARGRPSCTRSDVLAWTAGPRVPSGRLKETSSPTRPARRWPRRPGGGQDAGARTWSRRTIPRSRSRCGSTPRARTFAGKSS
jgi:hypothetical protein